jgi:hypothetical protein
LRARLEPQVKPLLTRLRGLLGSGEHTAEEMERRIRIIHLGARRVALPHFELVANAVLNRQRLHIAYVSRSSNERTERDISPQRLVHHRENWYCDAWCHLREDLRSFAVDAIQSAELLDKRAKNVPESELDEVLASGYGIFSGRKTTWAKLRFTPERARWVSAEQWHPQQKGRFDPDGSYVARAAVLRPSRAREGHSPPRPARRGARAGEPARGGEGAARGRAGAVLRRGRLRALLSQSGHLTQRVRHDPVSRGFPGEHFLHNALNGKA